MLEWTMFWLYATYQNDQNSNRNDSKTIFADPLPLPPPPRPLSIVTADPDWSLSTFCKSGFVLNKSQNVSTRRSWKSTTTLRKLLWKPFRPSFMQILWRQSALSCRFLKSFFAIYQWCQLQRCAPCFDPYKTSLSYSSSTLSNLSKLAWQFIMRFLIMGI